jgi:GntR family transcriptional regulator
MLIHVTDLSSEPLHAQISRQILAMILTGSLKEGDILPSIRTQARELKVGIITVQRAYDDLVKEGVLHAKSGKGYFVKQLTDKQKTDVALNRMKIILEPLIMEARAAGLDKNLIRKTLEELLKKED